MAKKGQVFQTYTEEFKLRAVQSYLGGSTSYQVLADKLGIRSCTQLKTWVRKHQNGEKFDMRKGSKGFMKGRSRTKFSSIEEERDYLKAQVDYLKKRYPNLLKETPLVDSKATKSLRN
ncbi:transposase [Bacillus sp. FJAT-18019]|nr:transposase [Bacillus sp. FJAT-18019]KOP68372.1 transposase [Bacillus sp. FJAT-18019]